MNRKRLIKYYYTGVRKHKDKRSWQARMYINYKEINIGHFKTEEEALNARNQYIIDNNLTEHKLQ